MRIQIVPDIHGRHEILSNQFDHFLKKGYDKIILLGDLADSYDRSNEDILRCFKIAFDMKELLGERMEWLIGNHELHYMFSEENCSGYRSDLAATLGPWMMDNKKLLKVAHQEGMHLFTHAGVQKKWFKKYKETIYKMEELTGSRKLADNLNAMLNTSETKSMLTEVGVIRGGWRGDYGGPFWCDRREMESYGPLAGYRQFVGHTPQKFVETVDKFEGDKHYNNTSVTFCDIFGKDDDKVQMVEIYGSSKESS